MTDIQIISWQLTRRCNLECEYCFTSSLPGLGTSSELSTEECFTVLEQLKNTPGINKDVMLVLTGGEALLRKDIYDIIKKSDEQGFYTVLGTNGALLSDVQIEKLRPYIKGISVNIDYVKIPKRFPQLWRAAETKMNAVKRLNIKKFPFVINTTIHKKNIEQLEDIAAFAVEHGAHSLNFFSLVPTGRGSVLYDATQSNEQIGLQKVIAIINKYDSKIKIKTKCAPHISAYLFKENPGAIRIFSGSGGCPAAKSYLCISPEGNILPCPYFPASASAGNIKEIKIELALQSKIFRELSDRNLKGNCGNCEFSYLCSGCRARSFVMENDYLGWDSLCSYQPHDGEKVTEETIIQKGGTVYDYKTSTNYKDVFEIVWLPEAEERLKRIPPFVRNFVKSRIEINAREKNIALITPQWMDEIRSQIKPGIFGSIGHPQSIKK